MYNQLRKIFDLHADKDSETKITEDIQKQSELKGSNTWILIFAIFIASIGLNINSTAVIIGAMLISPLMGPIVGIGFALGVNNFVLLRRSLRNLAIATVVSIIVSAIYFYLSPLNDAKSELLARTTPSIYDVLIAFFGGLAGIVGLTRTEKNGVIPGVAIATALMPPLCTVGYGIATMQAEFIFGALYLYSINCLFICLATLAGVKYLQIPSVTFVSPEKAVKTRRVIATLVIAMVAPSTYFAYSIIKNTDYESEVKKYITETFTNQGYTVVYSDVDYESTPKNIKVALLGKNPEPDQLASFEQDLTKYRLGDTKLTVLRDDNTLSVEDWDNIITSIKSESDKIKALEARLIAQSNSTSTATQLLREIRSINPAIEKVAIGSLTFVDVDSDNDDMGLKTNSDKKQIILVYYDKDVEIDTDLLSSWLKERLNDENLMPVFIPNDSTPTPIGR